MSPNTECIKHLNYNHYVHKSKSSNSGQHRLPSSNHYIKSGFLKAMKIISVIVILVILFRETRHQFLYPSFPLLLATEEFIEPESPSAESSPVPKGHLEGDGTVEIPAEQRVTTKSVDDALPPHQQRGESTVSQAIPATTSTLRGEAKFVAGDHPHPPLPPSTFGTVQEEKVGASVDKQNGVNTLLNALSQEERMSDGVQHLGTAAETNAPATDPASDRREVDRESEGNVSKTDEVKVKSREEEEPIPSYMEWAQKKQLELISNTAGQNGQGGSPPSTNGGNNGHTSAGQQNGNRSAAQSPPSGTSIDANLKNFASPDCGAKVVQSNSGSTNPSGVLSSSHDEYMLNKCGVPVWFVVELCEPLTIERVSLGNLELFSSSPKEFELGISDRYPTRDWVKLGPFGLPDARAIHPIALPSTNSSTFGKFLKVSILSHHGSEHYCPLSVIRVNGKSEYEVLESETTHQEDTDNEENGLHEEQLDDQPRSKTTERSVVGRAKDAVLNIVNAVKAFSGSSSSVLSDLDGTSLSLKSKCRSVIQCIPSSFMKDEIYTLISCNSSNLLPFLSTHSPWCGWDYCQAIFSRSSIGLPWQPEGFYASLFGGPSVLHALCNFNQPLKEGCDPVLLGNDSISESSSSLSDVKGDSYINESLNSANASPSDLKPTPDDVSQAVPADPQQESEPQAVPPKSILDPGSTESSQEQQVQVEAPQALPSPGFTLPETQIPPPNNADDSSQFIPQQVQSAGGSQQKESVFVRLSNRIKTLERNQSLTASYLEELSRRFKKQNEDNSILNEANKKIQNDTRVRLLQVDEYYRQELSSLRRNIDDVRERLFTVQLQRSLLVIVCFSQTLLIVVGFIWVKRRLREVQVKIQSDSVIITKDKSRDAQLRVFNVEAESNRYIVGRKRSNSDVTPSSITEKSKKMKKKKRNVADTRALTNLSHPQSHQLLQNSKNNLGYNFSGSLATPKENINPLNPGTVALLSSSARSSSVKESLAMSSTLFQRPNSLLTKVDSPFLFHPSAASSIGTYLDSGVSASGRFALLASPSPESPVRLLGSKDGSGVRRSGSGSSMASSSTTSASSAMDRQGTKMILNGHSADSVTSGKKVKKGGLKAFMPKIFDR